MSASFASSYMTRVLRLTLLAPDVVEVTLVGSLEGVPVDWEGQIRLCSLRPVADGQGRPMQRRCMTGSRRLTPAAAKSPHWWSVAWGSGGGSSATRRRRKLARRSHIKRISADQASTFVASCLVVVLTGSRQLINRMAQTIRAAPWPL